ncbi:MAG: hypothetical protein OXG24_07080 [Gammaproteobacteria bacterium]|nr:hypothetical protein [Gammaproteobacteria bacterium]
MKSMLTVSKIVYWVFVAATGVWILRFCVFAFTTSEEGFYSLATFGIFCGLMYLLARVLERLSGMHGEFDQKQMLEGFADAALRISERARAAAQKEDDKEKESKSD